MAFQKDIYGNMPLQTRLESLQRLQQQQGSPEALYSLASSMGIGLSDAAAATGYSPKQIASYGSQQGFDPLSQTTQALPAYSLSTTPNVEVGGGVKPGMEIGGIVPEGSEISIQPDLMAQFRPQLMQSIFGLLGGGYGGMQNFSGFGIPSYQQANTPFGKPARRFQQPIGYPLGYPASAGYGQPSPGNELA